MASDRIGFTSAAPVTTTTRAGLRGKGIVIVEDNINNRLLFEAILEHVGVVTAYNETGEGILDTLASFKAQHNASPDFVLMDITLPNGRSGFDVFKEIRAKHKDLPVLAVSAEDSGALIPKLREAGFVGLISKPIAFQSFARQVGRIFKQWQEGKDDFIYIGAAGATGTYNAV
jgi:CheY-like chemotaxis protein